MTAPKPPHGSPRAKTTPSAADPPTFRLEVEAPDGRVWGANDGRPHWSRTAKRRQEWRYLGWLEARAARLPRLPAAELHVTIHLRNWRAADAHNYPGGPSLKGLIDGLVDAKVVPDDREPFLTVHMPTLAALDGGRPRVVVELRPKTASDMPTAGARTGPGAPQGIPGGSPEHGRDERERFPGEVARS